METMNSSSVLPGPSACYQKAWTPYQKPNTSGRFRERNIEVDQMYQPKPDQRTSEHEGYRGYPPCSFHYPHRCPSFFCSPPPSSASVASCRLGDGQVPRHQRRKHGQRSSDTDDTRPTHIRFESDRRPQRLPRAYPTKDHIQSSK